MKTTDIPMPDPDEKRRSIEFIVQSAPKKESFVESAREMLSRLGWRGLFAGVGDAAFVAVMAVVFIGIGLVGSADDWLTGRIYGAVFLFSPLTYMLLCLMTAWKEHSDGASELHATCRFTPRRLIALRMLFFGGAGAIVCGGISWALAACAGAEFLRLFGISLSALFLFAALYVHDILPRIACIGIWCFLAVMFAVISERFARIFEKLPVAVFFIAAALFLALFIMKTRSYFMKKGRYAYAVG